MIPARETVSGPEFFATDRLAIDESVGWSLTASTLIVAVPVKGKAPAVSQIKKDLASNGPPPPYADVQNTQSSAILDGGSSQTTTLDLQKSGQYILFCPLTDRDGGKPHDQEGLLTVQTVK